VPFLFRPLYIQDGRGGKEYVRGDEVSMSHVVRPETAAALCVGSVVKVDGYLCMPVSRRLARCSSVTYR
jgi:hypothetical protein